MNALTEKLINKPDFFLEWYLIFVYDVDMFISSIYYLKYRLPLCNFPAILCL
jgi:hypothetical protein